MATDIPGPSIVLDLIEAFRRSKTMFAAVSMHIFDTVHEHPATAAELAGRLDAHPGALERLLDSCASLGLLSKSDGKYSNTPSAEVYLRRASPHTMTGYIQYSDRALYRLWGDLEGAVRQGTHRWDSVFGGRDTLFSHFFATEESKRDFLAGMHGLGLLSSPEVVAAFDLSPYRRLVDLGGATGHLAIAAVERYPGLKAAVFDLAEVTPVTREYVGDRVEVIAGDFFADLLPEADLYALGRILHDWSEERIRALLRKIYAALPEGGALLIAEMLLDDDKSSPTPALMQSLNMLVCTEGRERTLGEYEALLREAGFSHVDGWRTDTALDAILAVR
jgi:acetylserotonin N-methyltransferase